jgi:hypothetical protein
VTGGLRVIWTSPGEVPTGVYGWFRRSPFGARVDGRFVAGSFA